jgi:hypothetical protein
MGLTATAWFLMITSFSPAVGISASRTSRGLAFAATMKAALLLMMAFWLDPSNKYRVVVLMK